MQLIMVRHRMYVVNRPPLSGPIGGASHVIASIIAGAEDKTDYVAQGVVGFKRELQQAAKQAERIEGWAKATGIWIDDIDNTLTKSLGSHIAEGGEAKVYDSGSRISTQVVFRST